MTRRQTGKRRLLALAALALAAWLGACDDLKTADDPVAITAPDSPEAQARLKPLPSHLELRVEREQVDVCHRPYGLALSTDGETLFVACAGSGQVMAVDTEFFDTRWTSRKLYERTYKLAVDPRRSRVYAIGMNGRMVHALDSRTGAVVATLNVSGNTADLALVPQLDRLIVTTTQPPHAALIDLADFRVAGTVRFPTPPGSLAIRPDGQLAVASSGLWEVTVDNTAPVQEPLYLFDPRKSGRTVDSLGLGGTQSREALFVQNGSILLVPERTSDTVAVYDVDNRSHLRTIQTGAAPEKIVPSPDGQWAFTQDSLGASITRIDVLHGTANGYVVLPANPQDLVVSPDGTELYAALSGGPDKPGQLAVIDTQSVSVVDLIALGKDPCRVAFSHGGRKVYVTNFISDSLSVLE